ncbi:hypothetical protein QUH73_09130 [Labilibaculum sp. K2S]|uniref:hypothetical protein n=1 Tax=Labilibaculum sp. K2S TaxID=3056386 RepID=UPI0025A411D9|nr:hypothetical protein [Labilibaculum sp. K2S]MDM8159976.1 hypothetical protein [Labilibaculum sp. K2S]
MEDAIINMPFATNQFDNIYRLYFILKYDGSFSNGWKYKNEQITHIINHQKTVQFTLLKGGHTECETYRHTVLVEECTNYYSFSEFGVDYSGASLSCSKNE